MIDSPWFISEADGFTTQDIEHLTLIDTVGIHADVVDPRPRSDFMDHRDRHGSPDADSVVLWFESKDDFDAFGQVTTRAAQDEFGCDWAYIYPTGLRAEFITGQFAAAIPRRDLATVAALMRRELAAEFVLSPAQVARRTRAAWTRRVSLLALVVLLVQVAFFGRHFTGWGWAGIISAGTALTMAHLTLENPYLRVALDRVRARGAAEVTA